MRLLPHQQSNTTLYAGRTLRWWYRYNFYQARPLKNLCYRILPQWPVWNTLFQTLSPGIFSSAPSFYSYNFVFNLFNGYPYNVIYRLVIKPIKPAYQV